MYDRTMMNTAQTTEKKDSTRYYVSFFNQRSNRRETIWFPTIDRRADFLSDLQSDRPTYDVMSSVREWETAE
jgi:hypothetical protein